MPVRGRPAEKKNQSKVKAPPMELVLTTDTLALANGSGHHSPQGFVPLKWHNMPGTLRIPPGISRGASRI